MDTSESIIKKSVWKYNNSKLHVKTIESGLHSDLYLNTDFVVSDPKLVESIVKDIFIKELNTRNIQPDWIVSYPPFGLPIAFELARQVNSKFGYINRKTKTCDFDIKEGETIIVIGDDIYSGGSIKETIKIMKSKGAIVESPILTIGNFTGTKSIMDLDVVSAISERGNLYEESECPMCKEGSKAVNPRTYWNELKKQ